MYSESEKIPVKLSGKKTGYAVWSEVESHHSDKPSNQVYRLYLANGTYFMHIAGWQLEKMRIA